jgi:predicted nucleotidyltransferase
MSALELLRQRAAERDALVERAVALLNDDQRVVAAWLYGSLGRGTQDELSDIDLWVVVLDDYINEVREKRHEFAAKLGNTLVIVDAPQNAPANGAFLTVLYEGEIAGPQHVDWTWQAASAASTPNDAKVLLQRVAIANKPGATPEAPNDRTEAASNEMAYFWMMVLVVAKYVVRGQSWEVVNLLAAVRHALDKAKWLLDASDVPPKERARIITPPPVQPIEQLTLLRAWVEEAEELALSPGKAATSMTSSTMNQVYEYLDLAARTITERP